MALPPIAVVVEYLFDRGHSETAQAAESPRRGRGVELETVLEADAQTGLKHLGTLLVRAAESHYLRETVLVRVASLVAEAQMEPSLNLEDAAAVCLQVNSGSGSSVAAASYWKAQAVLGVGSYHPHGLRLPTDIDYLDAFSYKFSPFLARNPSAGFKSNTATCRLISPVHRIYTVKRHQR